MVLKIWIIELTVSEKKIESVLCITKRNHVTPGRSNFLPQRHNSYSLCRRPLYDAAYNILTFKSLQFITRIVVKDLFLIQAEQRRWVLY